MESSQAALLDTLSHAPLRGWTTVFAERLSERTHGNNVHELVEPKPHVAAMARDFAGDHLPPEAVEIAQIAHLAELIRHSYLGQNIRRSLATSFGPSIKNISPMEFHDDESHASLRYTLALLSDFPIIADFSKTHQEKCQKKGRIYVDLKGLVDLAEKTNFESLIIKSALDYSNFQLLTHKSDLSDQEAAKLKRIITAIKTVNSPLLGLTGFDALEAEILSKVYCWELESSQNGQFVDAATKAFESLGGRQQLASTAEQFLESLFAGDQFIHDRVTADQHDYGVFFSDGLVDFNGGEGSEYRVLSRLKSVGATAKKMRALHKKTGALEVPMDIIGVTLIAKDKDQMADCLRNLFTRLEQTRVTFQSAPSRYEELHVKGRPDFLEMFGKNGTYSSLYTSRELNVKDQECGNGYEAVKITMLYEHEGMQIPIEIQVTHETARKEGRIGSGNHTIFKLAKLEENEETIEGDDESSVANEDEYDERYSITELSEEELLESFARLNVRKDKFDNASLEVNGESRVRAEKMLQEFQHQNDLQLANVALKR